MLHGLQDLTLRQRVLQLTPLNDGLLAQHLHRADLAGRPLANLVHFAETALAQNAKNVEAVQLNLLLTYRKVRDLGKEEGRNKVNVTRMGYCIINTEWYKGVMGRGWVGRGREVRTVRVVTCAASSNSGMRSTPTPTIGRGSTRGLPNGDCAPNKSDNIK